MSVSSKIHLVIFIYTKYICILYPFSHLKTKKQTKLLVQPGPFLICNLLQPVPFHLVLFSSCPSSLYKFFSFPSLYVYNFYTSHFPQIACINFPLPIPFSASISILYLPLSRLLSLYGLYKFYTVASSPMFHFYTTLLLYPFPLHSPFLLYSLYNFPPPHSLLFSIFYTSNSPSLCKLQQKKIY